MIGNAPLPGSTIGLLGAHLTSTIQENLFVEGKSFSYEDYHTFGADETKIIVFDSTAFEGENLIVNPFGFAATAGPIKIDFYTLVSNNDDGTELFASNRREGFPDPLSVLRLNPTGFSGTRFAGDLVPATGISVPTGQGSGNQPGLPFELNAAIKHAIGMTNEDGADVVFQMKMTWFEV
ncbi:hypothetical protein KAR91_64000 [Candidatus Pacearchaeota archaeon]|nr:hypothetical protein [Candidatus Pacearchaeota archaeon]